MKMAIIKLVAGIVIFKIIALPLEHSIIYHPTRNFHADPKDYGGENIIFHASDSVEIDGWLFRRDNARFNLLFFHGNAGNISHRLFNIEQLISRYPMNVFIFDYRGYGRSSGRASEKGIFLDSEAALTAFLEAANPTEDQKTIYFGRSLGSVFAARLAATNEPDALILESPLISAHEMSRSMFGIPLGPFLWQSLDTSGHLKHSSAPVLIVHGDRDNVIPIRHGKHLYEQISSGGERHARFEILSGFGHNDTLAAGERYWEIWDSFLKEL